MVIQKESPKIFGVDLSYTATGLATPVDVRVVSTQPGAPDEVRAAEIFSELEWRLSDHVAFLVVVEDIVPVRGNALARMGMLHGVIRHLLRENHCPFRLVAPGKLKKYSAGRGNADKAEVLASAIRRLGYAGSDHNEADALWLRQVGLRMTGQDHVAVPQSHADALKGLEPWK